MGEIDYESLPTNNLWQHLLAGAMAGMMEHCCMYPVDCVKVTADIHLDFFFASSLHLLAGERMQGMDFYVCIQVTNRRYFAACTITCT